MFFWLAKMIWMMAPIGRGGKGRAFPPVSISQWGQRADQRCFLSPTLTPVLPPSLRPRYLANRSKRHTTHALTSTSHGEPSAESQRPQGPRQRAGWAPDTHTRWGDTPAPSCICTNTHTQTHRLTLNGHIKLSFSLSPTHTHTPSLTHTQLISYTRWWWCTHTKWRLYTFQRGSIFFVNSGLGGGGCGTWQTYLHITSKPRFKITFFPTNLKRASMWQVHSKDLAVCSFKSNPSKLNGYLWVFSLQKQPYFCFDVVHVVTLAVVPRKYYLPPAQFRKCFEILGVLFLWEVLYLDAVVGRTCCPKCGLI